MPTVLAYLRPDFDPFLIRFSDTFGIKYYGLAYALGFAIAFWLLHLYGRRGRSPFGPAAQSDLLFWSVVGVMVGGRLGYFLFYDPRVFITDPLQLVQIWHGGMASHGGFLGVIAGTWWAARRHRIPFLTAGDVVVTLAPPGLMLGRIANFINGELWGKLSTVPWAMEFPIRDAITGEIVEHTAPRHPSQLYEAGLEGLALLLYTQWRIWRTPVIKQQPGRLAGEFLLGYAVARVICEFFRQNDDGIPVFLGLNRGAWLSFGLAAAGAWLILRAPRQAGTTSSAKQ